MKVKFVVVSNGDMEVIMKKKKKKKRMKVMNIIIIIIFFIIVNVFGSFFCLMQS